MISSLFLASPEILQQTGVPIISPAVCTQIWGQSRITDAMICAGASGSSSCQVYEDRSRRNTLPFQCCCCSQMCVFCRVILVVLWCVSVQGSGLWWALSLGKKALVTPVSLQSMPASPSYAPGSTGLLP